MNGSSLTLRVIGYLVVAEFFAFTTGWIAHIVFGVHSYADIHPTFDDLAYGRTRELVIASIVPEASGFFRIDPTAGLRAEFERNSKLKFAVFDRGRNAPLPGSSPELLPVFEDRAAIRSTRMKFTLLGDKAGAPSGYLSFRNTPAGQFLVAVYGYKFRWDDVFHAFNDNASEHIYYLIIPVAFSVVCAWFAVHRGLSPLRVVASQAARIDMSSLDQRLSPSHIPAEIAPLVDAMNDALQRLDDGVARQRRFTANAAHELRTPVAILTARIDAPKESSFLVDLERDARRIHMIVEQMLSTARLSERRADIAERIDLVETISSIVADTALLAIKSGRQINFEPPDSPVHVRGNRLAVESVVGNLIDNALRMEPEGGAIFVRVTEDATVEVIDHGPGVADAERDLIFEPFWRKASSKCGAGLGLAIAKELMDLHHGRICVEETPGGGGTFRLQFPTVKST